MWKECLLARLLILLPVLSINVWAQSSGAYLDALENEAEGLTLDKEAASKKKSSLSESPITSENTGKENNQSGEIVNLTSGLSLEDLGEVLKNNYMGSYLFYKNMTASQKSEVFEFYRKNPGINQVREKIIEVKKNK